MRKPRKIVSGANYHVTARTNRQEYLFESRDIKNLFMGIVKRAKKKFDFKITTFCIMGNHIHLMMKPANNESLSRIMQWILATFAINYNRRFKIHGHVWYDRFHSTVIQSYRQYLKTFEYITENPVKAELVFKAQDYEFGGIWYLQKGVYDVLEPPDPIIYLFLLDLYK